MLYSPTSEHVSAFSGATSSDFRHGKRQAPGDAELANQQAEMETRANWLNYYLGAPGTLLGAGLGLLVAYIVTEDSIKPTLKNFDAVSDRAAQKLINQLGLLYLRALNCVIIPFCFFTLVLVFAEITSSKSRRQAKAGWRVGMLSLFTSLLIVGQGIGLGMVMQSKFQGTTYNFRKPTGLFKCPTPSPTFILVNASTKELYCGAYTGIEKSITFSINDTEKVFALDPNVNKLRKFDQSIPEVLQVLLPLEDTQFTNASNVNIIHLVLGAIAAGVAVGLYNRRKESDMLINVLRELVKIFESMTSWTVACAPVALISLIAGPIYMATHNVFVATASNDLARLAWYLVGFIAVALVHSLIVLPLVLLILTRFQVMPFRFLLLVKEALWFNFGASSSRAGHPVLARNFDRSIGSPSPTSRFALDVGVTCNKNGGALYICMSIIWLYSNAGLNVYFNTSKIILLVIIATLGSYAVVPVRNGGTAIVICAFAMLSGLPSPNAMNFLLLAEFIIDPICTVVNAWSNAVVVRIVCFMKEN